MSLAGGAESHLTVQKKMSFHQFWICHLSVQLKNMLLPVSQGREDLSVPVSFTGS